MPGNTDTTAQARKKRGALQSTIIATVVRVFFAVLLIGLGWTYGENNLAAWLFPLIGIINLGMILPIWKTYQIRVKEIEGGEEDAAAQY